MNIVSVRSLPRHAHAVSARGGRPVPLTLWWASLVMLAGMALAQPAHAGLFDDEEARKAILDLRARLDAQHARSSEHQELLAALKRSLFDLNNQLEGQRAEMAKLRGQNEQQSQQIRDLMATVADLQRKQLDAQAGVEERLKKFEPQKAVVDGREGIVEADEKRQFDEALSVLRGGDFAGSISALQGFMRRYPNSLYNGQARYWLGSAQYGKGDVKEATATFRSFLLNFPEHPRVPDAMLNLANCQAELKDPKGARKTLEDLLRQHPQSDAAKAGRDRLSLLR